MIKIAISGQIDNDTKVAYTFPHKFNSACPTPEDEWLDSVADPRNARDFGAEEIFALWKNKHGNYYAIIFPSKNDSRNGRMMITIHTEKKVFTNGAVVVDALRKIKSIVDQNGPYLNDDFSKAPLLSTLDKTLANDYPVVSTDASNGKAYRVFNDEAELTRILQYPNQSEYSPYRQVLIVPSSCMEFASQNTIDYKEIKGEIQVAYNINRQLPEGVCVDKYKYNPGEIVEVKYEKEGYRTQKKSFRADDTGNKYADFNGTEITLKSAESVGIEFQREIRFEINPKALSQITIENLNHTITIDPTKSTLVTFPADLQEYKVRVSSVGYIPKDVTLTQADFVTGCVSVNLAPQLKKIKIVIDKDGHNEQGEVHIYYNDKLYPILFEIQQNGKKLYTTQNAIEKTAYNNNASNSSNGNKADNNKNYNNSGKPKESFKSMLWSWIKLPLIVLCAVCLLYLLYTIVPWPDSCFETKPTASKVDSDSVSCSVSEPGQNEDQNSVQNSASKSEKNEEVLKYMKKKDIWERSKMESSQQYVTIIDFISNGQIDEAIGHAYTTKDLRNGYWDRFVKKVKDLKESEEYDSKIKKEIQDAMRRSATTDKVNLKDLWNGVSKIKNNHNSTDASVTATQGTKPENADTQGGRPTSDNQK